MSSAASRPALYITCGNDRELRRLKFAAVFACQATAERGLQDKRERTKKPGDEDRSVKHLVTISRDMFSTTQDHTQ